MKTIYFEEISSTNDYLKNLDSEEDVLAIAKRQTGGRGTKGRSFISAEGGVYLSLLRLNPCKAEDCFSIMMNSAVAVVKTLHAFDIKAKIKWPNDILVDGKKICGILIENVFSGEMVARSIVGIGLNVNNDLAKEIEDIATSTKIILNKELSPPTVTATLCYNLYQDYGFEDYSRHLLFVGEEVTIITQKSAYKAFIDQILPNGNLKTKDGKVFSAGEISIR
ncbi:MAG: biotin--[Clostridia bacterium]|nr:biotin--[acetyl-CoA-carboxylase] ligase [Clostridia bacterium]